MHHMPPSALPFRLSSQAKNVLSKRLCLLALIGLFGAGAGWAEARHIPPLSARTLIEIGYIVEKGAVAATVTEQEPFARAIQADINAMADKNLRGRAFPKDADTVPQGRRFVMVTLEGGDADVLEKSLARLTSKHLAVLHKQEARWQERKRAKNFVSSREPPFPFAKIISNRAAKTVLPLIYAGLALTLGFIALLLAEREGRSD